MHSPASGTFTLFYACAVQFIGTFVQWSRYMLRACCKRVFVVPLSLIMDNFWFYLSYLYLQCTWMYVLSFPASERFEFRQNWNGLGRFIRATCTRLLAMSRPTVYEECRPRKEFIYVRLYCAVQDSTRFYPFAGLLFLYAGTRFVDSNKEFLKIESSSPLDS